MRGLRARIENDLPSCVPESPAPINILGVDKETLIQAANGGHRFTARHNHATNQHMDRALAIMRKIEHVFAGKP